jgi:phage terminase small subunit
MNAKQARFCAEYLVDLNANQAAIRAGYAPKSAHVNGPRLLKRADVQARLQELRARREERLEVRADDVVRELFRLAMCDIGKAFDADGNLLPLHQMPEDVRRAIAGVEVSTRFTDDGQVATVTKVKWWDKTRGLEMLGKHLKMFVDRHEHEVGATLAKLLEEAGAK